MVDAVKLKTLSLVAGHEADLSLLCEEMFRVGYGLAKGLAVGGEDAHAIGHVLSGFGFFCKAFGEPLIDSEHDLGLGPIDVAELLHHSQKLGSNIAASHINRTAQNKKLKSDTEERSIVSAKKNCIIIDAISIESLKSFNMASRFDPFELRHSPPSGFDHGAGAAEADAQVELRHFEPRLSIRHTLSLSSTETIDALPWITHTNDPRFFELVEHRMIDGGEILEFVDEDKGMLWVCSSKQ